MGEQRETGTGPTRRAYVRSSAAVFAGTALAGCTDGSSDGETPSGESGTDGTDPNEIATPTRATDTATDSGTDDADAAGDGGHAVSMEPVGTVEFDAVPETWIPYTGDYADMGVALGQAEGLAAIGVKARFGTHYYDELPGVSVDADDLAELWQDGTGKEIFYERDADVHVIDPNFMVNRLGWSQADVDEIGTNVAPFVGNTIFSRAYDWHDYRYYSLYEAFEKVATLFDERERYEAFRSYHDEVLEAVQSRLPADRPDIAILYPAEVPPESFYPYLVDEGTQSKQWRDLGVGDALAANDVTDAQAGGSTLDYEALLEIDPDAIAIRLQGEITESFFEENVRVPMADHDLGGELTAVQEDRVFYGGLTYQGPIIHLFQLERAAKGLYPTVFDADERLFDRDRVAAIVEGENEP